MLAKLRNAKTNGERTPESPIRIEVEAIENHAVSRLGGQLHLLKLSGRKLTKAKVKRTTPVVSVQERFKRLHSPVFSKIHKINCSIRY